MPVIHVEHKRWRFENPDINLHTGFTWLGTGSFVPKSLSARFLNQQSAAPVGLSQAETLVSDMFFSLWTNTYPEQMPNSLVPIDVEGEEVGWSKSAGVDQWTVVYANIVSQGVAWGQLSIRLLTPIGRERSSLRSGSFPTSSPTRRTCFPRRSRSARPRPSRTCARLASRACACSQPRSARSRPRPRSRTPRPGRTRRAGSVAARFQSSPTLGLS